MKLSIDIEGVDETRNYTLIEASEIIPRSSSWLYDEARAGRLRCVNLHPSRARLVSGAEIKRYIREVVLCRAAAYLMS